MTFIEEGAALLPELVALRRELHLAPEVGLELPNTQARIIAALAGLDLEITLGKKLSSVVAVLRGGQDGPTVLLRGDMDALPVTELSGVDFASTNGSMHACGHDLHVSGLVGAAKLLAAHRDELAGNVIFMFQPGEEGDGGAGLMIEEGVLQAAGDRPIAAYGIHVAPGASGVFTSRGGPLMAGANELRITVHGSGGHGSQPHTAMDPVPALAEMVTALQNMATRRFSVFDPIVVTVTQLAAGSAINVIPDTARLGATVRTLSQESVDKLITATKELADGIAAAHGCTAEVRFDVNYPVTVNDVERTREAMDGLRSLFGDTRVVEADNPLMGSEDFSLVLNEIPGTFLFLLCSPADVDPATAAWNHSPRVLFDDAVLGDQAAALAQLAFNRLAVKP
ncbi:amidohydrolase [Paenarthrobacter sp. Z7-10]|uniref:M20 metallopeptidase family protein n=1 Tax=Paenarthrobacter sp. Z7-10 TaxID=2787635 RepID=UPI0022A9C7D6|nr:M20 family metallopeptidase [Paenarthrobacter sp. Z7-10]MCZ2403632.1 amidohydrolase [Paenarthrobacter sp. Z7-10]